MSTSASQVSRRAFLRSASTLLALPALESFGFKAFAAEKAPEAITRMAFLYIPNGVTVHKGKGKGGGFGYELSQTLHPLAGRRNNFSVISNLPHEKAESTGEGAGDHAGATATSLRGCKAR